ncbi:hypothetical protein SAMN05660420_01542 [Desulfuromusa kysingii]|uniref:Uncharacterized protein n=1 Tax=Desulfuromusa kysingii TaxID=37625 RepID=A0A1H3ZJV8_9BACT|nr:hypothetical protein [Desulfuromusa kysingii]SEA23544.1 hypothetical protein SAMN05660420_01542 [Desulfuromusa kysingii]
MIDVNILILSSIFVSTFFCSAFFVYDLEQKTYNGFRLWTFSILTMTLGFLAIVARGTIPLELSIFIVSGFFTLAAVIRLDAIKRFLQGKSLNKSLYAIPVFVVLASSIFYFVFDRIDIRTSIVSAVLFLLSISISWVLIQHSTPENKMLYYSAAIFIALRGAIILSRAFAWQPENLQTVFSAGIGSTIQLEFGLVSEIGQNVIFLMMNSQRSAADYIQSESKLHSTIIDLKKANEQIKTLEGVIPICMYCKNIRDEKETWNQLEQYISDHSDASFSHGICPDCLKKQYPEYIDTENNICSPKANEGLIKV